MSDEALNELRQLRQQVAALLSNLSPFIGQDEMQVRYNCTGKTLLAMERRGDIPERVKGKWVRVEVVEWERNHK
jgi:hypothetical protein